jgi:hypothetical protein
MLNVEDPRSWFAIAALAIALIFMAGHAHGTLRCGYYAGRGESSCFADAPNSTTQVFRQMADERRRCSYFEPACRVRDSEEQKGRLQPAVNTGSGYPVPPRGVNVHAPQHDVVIPGHG